MTENASPSQILMAPPEVAPAGKPAAPEAAPDLSKVSEADFKAHLGSDFTPDQLRDLAAGEVKAGRLTQAQADEMLKADGVMAEKPVSAIVDVEGFPPAAPHEYTMPRLVGDDGKYTPQVAAFDRQARQWLSTAGFTKEIGSAIAAEITKVSAETRDMDDTSRELYRRTEAVKLQRLWPDEKAHSLRAALAVQLVDEIEKKAPGLKALLEKTGAGDNAAVIAHFALHAERLYKTKYPKG